MPVLVCNGYLSESGVLDSEIFDEPVYSIKSALGISPDFSACDSQDDCRNKLTALDECTDKLISTRDE